jgi:mRNA interferase RelE/StbE
LSRTTYRVELADRADRALRRLDRQTQARIVAVLGGLTVDPRRHPQVKRLVGRNDYRLRFGDYRILFQIEDDRLVVLVLQIGHRREVYR